MNCVSHYEATSGDGGRSSVVVATDVIGAILHRLIVRMWPQMPMAAKKRLIAHAWWPSKSSPTAPRVECSATIAPVRLYRTLWAG